MRLSWFVVFAVVFLIACEKGASPKNDFEAFCEVFSGLTTSSQYSSMAPHERDNILQERLAQQLPADSNATTAWVAVSNAEPQYRYSLMKDAAIASSIENWTCPSLEKEAENVGQFGYNQ